MRQDATSLDTVRQVRHPDVAWGGGAGQNRTNETLGGVKQGQEGLKRGQTETTDAIKYMHSRLDASPKNDARSLEIPGDLRDGGLLRVPWRRAMGSLTQRAKDATSSNPCGACGRRVCCCGLLGALGTGPAPRGRAGGRARL